uniref:Uncharacterized protein n=1 Tax=Arundo donax TaxID=35708 RepID=A0A0A9GBS8_ARUDO
MPQKTPVEDVRPACGGGGRRERKRIVRGKRAGEDPNTGQGIWESKRRSGGLGRFGGVPPRRNRR